MKTLYFDCSNGISGNMLCAALCDLLEEQDDVLGQLALAGIPGFQLHLRPSVERGITGKHFSVGDDWKDRAETQDLSEVLETVDGLLLPDPVIEDCKAVYTRLEEARREIFGDTEDRSYPVDSYDAVTEIACTSLLIRTLEPDKILASNVQTGSALPESRGAVPCDAVTAILLQNVPIYSTGDDGILCSPVGAALLSYYVEEYLPFPVMNLDAIGHGMESRHRHHGNILTAYLGDMDDDSVRVAEPAGHRSVTAIPEADKKAILNRISRSVGHLTSIKHMVEDDRDANEILIQLAAVRSSITGASRVIMKDCLKESIGQADSEDDLEEIYRNIERFIK